MLNIKSYIIILLFLLHIGLFSCKSSKKTKSKTVYKEKRTNYPRTKTPIKEADKIQKLIQEARSYTGTKYKFGGVSRSGMDCSGLVCVSFQTIDISLPRTSAEQSQKGLKIPLKDIQEGDLVFFTDKKGHKKVTHVGIVTEVKGKDNVRFIHSSTKLGVIEDNLYADYYIKLFLKAVRIF